MSKSRNRVPPASCGVRPALLFGMACSLFPTAWVGAGQPRLPDQDTPIRTVTEVDATGADRIRRYGEPRLAQIGYLDVTQPPYNADPSGRRDATAALQQAVKDARDARLITFLPAGRYLISDTIQGIQGTVKRDDWPHEGYSDPWVMHASFEYPCVIMGPGEGSRAVIVLADRAAGFDDPQRPKPVMYLWARMETPHVTGSVDPTEPQMSINFNQKIVNVDFELGADNPGAVAINHQGAEGSTVEDVTIDATGAFAGIQNAPGSGGAIHGVTVTGGRYGLYVRNDKGRIASQPMPVMSGLRLTGQQEAAVLHDGNGPLTIVGAQIDGAGIAADSPRRQSFSGALNIVDTVIRMNRASPAVKGNHSIVLQNVFIGHAAVAAEVTGQWTLAGIPDGWLHVQEYAAPASNPAQEWAGGEPRRDDLWIGGHRHDEPIARTSPRPPPDTDEFVARHRWPSPFPSAHSPGAVNVKDAPFNAKGDGVSDDAPAIQRAIDAHPIVFLPKGTFALSRPLRLHARTKLMGIGNVQTVLTSLPGGPAYRDPDAPQPLVETVDDAAAETVLAFMKLLVPVRNPSVYALRWRAGRNSIVRNVYPIREAFHAHGAAMNHPLVRIEGSGGGRWYTNVLLHWWDQGPDYRHLLIEGTREPLAFYMLEPQHGRSTAMVEIRDAENIDIFGVKAEGDFGLMTIARSRAIRIFGYSGNGMPMRGWALFSLEDCRDILLANIAPRFKRPGAYGALGIASNPAYWYILNDKPGAGRKPVTIPGTGQFVLYKD
jgi:hypothetical protein